MELHRNTTPIQMRNYGRIVQDMIGYACSLPVGPERDSLEVYIAQCMRQIRKRVFNAYVRICCGSPVVNSKENLLCSSN